jgi:hypothetical protein
MAAVGLTTLALFTTACSAKPDGEKKPNDVSGENKKADQAREHRKCLREHGLDVPEPKPEEEGQGVGVDGNGMSKEKLEKAMKACQSKAGGSGAGEEMSQADKDKAVKYARCMRKNGFNLPDPKFDDGSTEAMPALRGEQLKKFEKANKACASVQP